MDYTKNSFKSVLIEEKVSKTEKSSLKGKFLEFRKSGLESYGKYLADQLENACKGESKGAYKKYIEQQIKENVRKITTFGFGWSQSHHRYQRAL